MDKLEERIEAKSFTSSLSLLRVKAPQSCLSNYYTSNIEEIVFIELCCFMCSTPNYYPNYLVDLHQLLK